MLDRESPITLSKGSENPERRRVTRKDCPVNSGESLSTVSVDDKNLVVFSEDSHEKEKQEDEKLIDFLPFISVGTVALPEGNGNVECPIRILRDTGSSL